MTPIKKLILRDRQVEQNKLVYALSKDASINRNKVRIAGAQQITIYFYVDKSQFDPAVESGQNISPVPFTYGVSVAGLNKAQRDALLTSLGVMGDSSDSLLKDEANGEETKNT